MLSFGIDLGGTNIAAGLVDENGKILAKHSVPTMKERDADSIVKDMAGTLYTILEKTGKTFDEVGFCGISTPGIANQDTQGVDYSCNLPFVKYPLVKKLSELIPLKNIGIENDANAAAKGEAEVGAAKGSANSVFITLGTGVGGGVIIDHKIYRGFNFAGTELGHIVIVHNGELCGCGRKGCWEAYSSVTGLIRMTKEKMKTAPDSKMWEIVGGDIEKVNGKTSYDGLRANDKAAIEVVDTWIDYLACGLTNIVNIFQPEILSIGGGISKEGELLLAPLREKINKEQYARNCDRITEYKIAQLGNDAGIVGAAMLYR
ncbi:MAG: ROK family protein [Ruminococcaceae bacterium]|nr:ROK family protein [Oscillospiraceae bacterium]